MQEIGGAVERVDDEAVRFVGALDHAGFLDQEAVARPRLRQFLDQDALGALVGDGDEIRRPLERDLQVLNLTEIADQPAAGLAGRGDHHVQGGGEITHDGSL